MKVGQKRRWKILLVAGAALALVAGMAATVPSAYAGGTIKSDDPDLVDFPRNGYTDEFYLWRRQVSERWTMGQHLRRRQLSCLYQRRDP